MHVSPESQREMLRTMQTIRRFEERASADYHAGNIYGVVHCYVGEEAVAAGVCAALAPDDQIISTHRGHGHCIAKGADLDRMMAELYGRETGYCKGKGGSMHIADFAKGMLGANGIVAGGISIVTGAGLAAQLLGNGRVAVSLLRRRRRQCRTLSRVHQHRGGLEAPGHLRLREQPLCGADRADGDACHARCGRPCRGLRHPGRRRRRKRHLRGPRSGQQGRGPRTCRGRAPR